MQDYDIKVSSKHLIPRTIGLIAALIVAVGAFAFGVSRIGHKDPGYYLIDTEASEEAVRYAHGFSLNYRFDGSSSEIRTAMNQLKADYSTVLLRAYKLTDPEVTYDGFANIATLNASLGTPVSVSEELYGILCDAWEKTCQRTGYNMFAGLYYAAWDELLYLNDPVPFDPALNPDTLTRLTTLWEACNMLSNFTFEVTDEASHTILIDASDTFKAMMTELETGTAVLDLNRLKNAYILMLVRDVLSEGGYTEGYLSSEDGCSLTLPGYSSGTYLLYDASEEAAGSMTACGQIQAPQGSGAVLMRSFALNEKEEGYYEAEADGSLLYRSRWIGATAPPSAKTAALQSREAVLVMSRSGNLADAVLAGLNVMQQVLIDPTIIQTPDITIALISGNDPGQILLSTDTPELFTTGEGYEVLLCD